MNVIELKTAIARLGRDQEVCVHCGKPLFYDIDGIMVRDLPDRLQYTQSQIAPPHLKWLVNGIKIGDHVYYRNVCWPCLFSNIRKAYVEQKWGLVTGGWIKEILDGYDVLPPKKMAALSKKILPLVITNVAKEDIVELTSKYDTASLKSFINRYGEIEGQRKYDEYVKFHSVKNTYEWRKEHKGWTKEQFDIYNKSRATTLENFIKRYGEDEGTSRFTTYCKLQAYAGCALEYFQELYGEEEGLQKYQEINKKKKLSLETFIEKYGKEEGYARWTTWHNHAVAHGYAIMKEIVNRRYSKVSQELFNQILDNLDNEQKERCYFATHNGEISITFSDGYVAQPDFALGNKLIEFNGDFWHRNPKLYVGDLVTKEVEDIWKIDEIRNREFNNLGYLTLTVWEFDYRRSPETVLEQCLDFLKKN